MEWAYNALGGVRPVLIGQKLETTYHFGSNYVAIEIDVGSNWIAKKSRLCPNVLNFFPHMSHPLYT